MPDRSKTQSSQLSMWFSGTCCSRLKLQNSASCDTVRLPMIDPVPLDLRRLNQINTTTAKATFPKHPTIPTGSSFADSSGRPAVALSVRRSMLPLPIDPVVTSRSRITHCCHRLWQRLDRPIALRARCHGKAPDRLRFGPPFLVSPERMRHETGSRSMASQPTLQTAKAGLERRAYRVRADRAQPR